MKVLIVYAHPEPQSFNGALFDTAIDTLEAAGHTVMTSDLYAMGFDPVSDRRNFLDMGNPNYLSLRHEQLIASETDTFAAEIDGEMAKLEEAELLLFQFPLWWFGMPAILKGWVERVFALGRIHTPGYTHREGRFAGRRALLSITTGEPANAFHSDAPCGDMSTLLAPIAHGMLHYIGFDVLQPAIFHAPQQVAEAVRDQWLNEWAARLTTVELETPIIGATR